ncbi:hypothetical protein [Aliiroseovarius sp. YM-037]|uniref:hypothetical protein n=1 Tax=Aliiroseovarius sp. YM-037 TaxID=3341728 RepID=UPI003A80DFDD
MIRVVFLHRPGHINSGGKIMRCDQLAALAREHAGDGYSFEVLAPPRKRFAVRQRRFARNLDGAIVILLKNTLAAFTPQAVDVLRKSVRGLCIDHLDVPATEATLTLADVHIAASYKGEKILAARLAALSDNPRGTQAVHLAHHADPRLRAADKAPTSFNIGYFGKLSNTIMPGSLQSGVIIPDYGKDVDFGSAIEAMQQCPMHYGVRGPVARPGVESKMAKPFTKGFNAAAVGANVLVNRQVDDATDYLGEDYPFLIENTSEAAISDGIAKAREMFGGREWVRGLDVMHDIRARTSPAAVVHQLKDILALFG